METAKTNTPVTPTTPNTNGAPVAADKPKRHNIQVAPTEPEHAEIVAYATKLLGTVNANNALGIEMDLPLAKVVLALTLKAIREQNAKAAETKVAK